MKKYTDEEINDLKKALYKAVQKELAKGKTSVAQEVVRDVLDPNYNAQVDPDKIPTSGKTSVINKAKSAKSHVKGVIKLKKFIKKKGK